MSNDGNNNVKNNVERPQNRHLIPIKPGETRNPNGRPVGKRSFSTIFAAAVERYALEYLATVNAKRSKEKQKPLSMEEAALDPEAEMVMAQIDKARKGDTRAFEALMKFQHPQKHQHSGDPDAPIDVSVESAKERAARMLALYGHPVKPAAKGKKQPTAPATVKEVAKAVIVPEEPEEPTQADPAPTKKAKKPAKPNPSMPKARRSVSRRPVVQRFKKRDK